MLKKNFYIYYITRRSHTPSKIHDNTHPQKHMHTLVHTRRNVHILQLLLRFKVYFQCTFTPLRRTAPSLSFYSYDLSSHKKKKIDKEYLNYFLISPGCELSFQIKFILNWTLFFGLFNERD